MSNLFQRIILGLRKLGVLRYGKTTYTYTSGKNMPASAIMNDVFDEKKDLWTKEDLRKK